MARLGGVGSVWRDPPWSLCHTETHTFMVMGVLASLFEVPGKGLGFGDGWQLECVTRGGGRRGGGGDEGSRGQEFAAEPVLSHTAAG